MPGPQLPPLDLTLDEQRDLTALVRRHTAPQQLVLRARIILLAADGLNNSQIARTLGLEADTVRLWRQRWQTERKAVARQFDHQLVGRRHQPHLATFTRDFEPPARFAALVTAAEEAAHGVANHLRDAQAAKVEQTEQPAHPGLRE